MINLFASEMLRCRVTPIYIMRFMAPSHALWPPKGLLLIGCERRRALDDDQNLTALGRILARLPLDPHVGAALLLGHWLFGLGDAMATICAAMSFDEPFQFEKSAGYMPWHARTWNCQQMHSDGVLKSRGMW